MRRLRRGSASTPGLPNPRIARLESVASSGPRREGGTPRRIRSSSSVFIAVASTLPFWLNTGDLFAYGLFTLLYATLGLGLNVVVGFAGLLDLGYVAYFGIGAYGYAIVSSQHYGIHWPTLASLPAVAIFTGLIGLLLGLTSRRLIGDYFAIVTLFFLQAFLVFTNTANPVIHGVGLTGGSSGIGNVDPLQLLRPRPDHGQTAVLLLPGRAHPRDGRPLLREPLTDRARLARASRGSPRGRGDEHSRQSAQASRHHHRCDGGRALRRDLRSDPGGGGVRATSLSTSSFSSLRSSSSAGSGASPDRSSARS